MSEVNKHYGADPVGLDRRPDTQPDESAQGTLGRAHDAVREAAHTVSDAAQSVADKATRAAGQVRHTVTDGYERASDWAQESYESVSRNATYARRRSAVEFRRSRRGVESFIDENPIMVGVAGLAAGLLIGALLPGTKRENKAFGRYSDDLKRDGLRYANEVARDVAEQGRTLMRENLRTPEDPRPPER